MGLGVVMDAKPPYFYSWARESCIGLWDLRSLCLYCRVKGMCSYVLKQTQAGGGGEQVSCCLSMSMCCLCLQICTVKAFTNMTPCGHLRTGKLLSELDARLGLSIEPNWRYAPSVNCVVQLRRPGEPLILLAHATTELSHDIPLTRPLAQASRSSSSLASTCASSYLFLCLMWMRRMGQ
jgi:hypothetical protein